VPKTNISTLIQQSNFKTHVVLKLSLNEESDFGGHCIQSSILELWNRVWAQELLSREIYRHLRDAVTAISVSDLNMTSNSGSTGDQIAIDERFVTDWAASEDLSPERYRSPVRIVRPCKVRAILETAHQGTSTPDHLGGYKYSSKVQVLRRR